MAPPCCWALRRLSVQCRGRSMSCMDTLYPSPLPVMPHCLMRAGSFWLSEIHSPDPLHTLNTRTKAWILLQWDIAVGAVKIQVLRA